MRGGSGTACCSKASWMWVTVSRQLRSSSSPPGGIAGISRGQARNRNVEVGCPDSEPCLSLRILHSFWWEIPQLPLSSWWQSRIFHGLLTHQWCHTQQRLKNVTSFAKLGLGGTIWFTSSCSYRRHPCSVFWIKLPPAFTHSILQWRSLRYSCKATRKQSMCLEKSRSQKHIKQPTSLQRTSLLKTLG